MKPTNRVSLLLGLFLSLIGSASYGETGGSPMALPISFACLNTITFEKMAVSTLHRYLKATLPNESRISGEYNLFLDYPLNRGIPIDEYIAEIQIDNQSTWFGIGVNTRHRDKDGFCEIINISRKTFKNGDWVKSHYFHVAHTYLPEFLAAGSADEDINGELIGQWFNHYYSVRVVHLPSDEYMLSFSGQTSLTSGMLAPFKEAIVAIPENKNIVVNLDSLGGNSYVFEQMQLLTRQKCEMNVGSPTACRKCEIRTDVSDFRSCGSACMGFYAIGHVKTYGPAARFGFHSAHNTLDNSLMAGFVERLLKDWGFNEAWIEKQRAMGILSQQEMTFFSGHELGDSGLFDAPQIPLCSSK